MSNPFAAPISKPRVEVPQTRIPPLSISHLLMWMTISAVTVSSILGDGGNLPPVMVYSGVASGIVSAVSITALWILFRARESLATMMRLPGHWMVFFQGTNGILMMLSWLLTYWFPDFRYDPPAWASANAYAYRFWESLWPLAIGLVSTAAYVYAAWKTLGIWRWLFGVGAFFCLASTLLPIGFSFFPMASSGATIVSLSLASCGNAVVGVAMVLVAWFGQHDGEYRDWLHWLGVSLTGFGGIAMIIGSVVSFVA